MKVLYVAAECKPFSKVGGVGDVAGELPPALKKEGLDIEILTPMYSTIPEKYLPKKTIDYMINWEDRQESVQVYESELEGVPVHFLGNDTYFSGDYGSPYINSPKIPFYDDALRFLFFSKAAVHFIKTQDYDIIHINDWPFGFLFGYMEMKNLPQKKVLTIHNMNYQGNIGKDVIADWDLTDFYQHPKVSRFFRDPNEDWNSINPMRLAIELADRVNTVSPTYAREIILQEDPARKFSGGKQLYQIAARLFKQDRLSGILNGYNYTSTTTDAAFKSKLRVKAESREKLSGFFADPGNVIFGFVGRAVEQKLGLLPEPLNKKPLIEHLLDVPGVNVAMVTSGLAEYEQKLSVYSKRDNFLLKLAYDQNLGELVNMGSDYFLMPSLFEPCGITQLEAMQNATPPIVHWTGGLADTVTAHTKPDGTGIGFSGGNVQKILKNFLSAVKTGIEIYRKSPEKYRQLQQNGFRTRFTWQTAAKTYIHTLYS